jgi:hypothetical protein
LSEVKLTLNRKHRKIAYWKSVLWFEVNFMVTWFVWLSNYSNLFVTFLNTMIFLSLSNQVFRSGKCWIRLLCMNYDIRHSFHMFNVRKKVLSHAEMSRNGQRI